MPLPILLRLAYFIDDVIDRPSPTIDLDNLTTINSKSAKVYVDQLAIYENFVVGKCAEKWCWKFFRLAFKLIYLSVALSCIEP